MKNSLFKLIIAGAVFLLNNTIVVSQDTVDSSAAKMGDLTQPRSLGDTVLNRNIFEKGDSLQEYKAARDFMYMRYLDSLLRNTKGLTMDTFNIQNTSATRNRRRQVHEASDAPARSQINIFSFPFVKIILWVMAAFLIGFLVWKLFLGENFFRRKREYKVNPEEEKEEELSDPAAYDALIARAAQDKNFRLAIRYYYLQALKKLSDSGMVQFSPDKTNYQYVTELHGKPFQNDFAAITLNYEYVWYGKFEIGEDVYGRLAGNFRSFNHKI